MVTLKINNSKTELIASEDIEIGTTIFLSLWSNEQSENPFYLPKQKVHFEDKDYISTDDFVEPVTLDSFGQYIKIAVKNASTTAIIDFEKKTVQFVALRNIKKNEIITYNIDPNYFTNVTIQ